MTGVIHVTGTSWMSGVTRMTDAPTTAVKTRAQVV